MNEYNYWIPENLNIDPFAIVLNEKISDAEKFLHKACGKISEIAPALNEIHKLNVADIKYRVDFTPEQIENLENGVQTLIRTKDGRLLAQFVKDGKFSDRVGIIKEVENKFDSDKLLSAMAVASMRDELQAISEQLNIIDDHINQVLIGQHNDRLGVYYNGISLLFEARKINDLALKNAVISQALSALGESFFKISLELKADIEYLANAKKLTVKQIDDTADKIDHNFAAIHQAALLKAAIYCELGEFDSMTESLCAYSQFINEVIAGNAQSLIECDKNDKGTYQGKWNTRSRLKLDVSGLWQIMTENKKQEELQ